jgi:hypothetical protein
VLRAACVKGGACYVRRGDGSAGWGEARVTVRGPADEGVRSGRVREGKRPGAAGALCALDQGACGSGWDGPTPTCAAWLSTRVPEPKSSR